MLKKCLLKLIGLLLVALLFVCPITVRAAETAEDEAFYASHSWDELIELILDEGNCRDQVLAYGYYNTVTGEEHYYNGDMYIAGASLYKLPLNMYYAEQIQLGLRSWDDDIAGRSYREVQEASLTYSNNPFSLALVNRLGGWAEFRSLIAPYMNEEADDESFCKRSTHFTARQMTACTALLAREPERFPGVIEKLLPSAPGLFLEYADVPYDIAQKYGNNAQEGNVFHVAGIVYTPEPIVLVVLTADLAAQRLAMEQYCRWMCGYTNYHMQLRVDYKTADIHRFLSRHSDT